MGLPGGPDVRQCATALPAGGSGPGRFRPAVFPCALALSCYTPLAAALEPSFHDARERAGRPPPTGSVMEPRDGPGQDPATAPAQGGRRAPIPVSSFAMPTGARPP